MIDIINKIDFEKDSINKILEIRDSYNLYSIEWELLNTIKAFTLEVEKPSTNEYILTYLESDMDIIPEGFSTVSIENIKGYIRKRSILEYNPIFRHPIPYVIIKHKDFYFFALREKGSGELMLIGKKGMLGGHVTVDPINYSTTSDTINFINEGLYREIEEEANIVPSLIDSVTIKGLIKGNDGVDKYHLGIVYEVEISSMDIDTEEEGVLSGAWIHKKDLKDNYESLESWAKIIYDNSLLI